MVALAVGATWMLAALACPSFGQAVALDTAVAAHEHVAGGDAGHSDNDLCCKALGDSTTVFQVVTAQQPELSQALAPAIAIADSRPLEQIDALPRDRPPIQYSSPGRAKRFISFSSHAPPAVHV